MKRRELPSQDELLRIFTYNEDTGELIWRYRPECNSLWNARFVGKVAGTPTDDDGRLKVGINGKTYFVHLVIWKMIHGVDAPRKVDHRSCDCSNNRSSNLRLASDSENACNRRVRRDKSLPKGVSIHKATGKFVAQICKDYVVEHLGLFESEHAAHEAYVARAKVLHGDFFREA